MRRAHVLLYLAAGLVLLGTAHGDIIHFKDGKNLEGEVVRESEDAVVLRTQTAELSIPRSVIASIEKKKSKTEIYREKLASAKTPEDFEALIEWCKEQGLETKEAEACFRDAVAERRRAENPKTYCRACNAYGDVVCSGCGGTGLTWKPCSKCAEKGSLPCGHCSGKGDRPCPECDGKGKAVVTCPECKGRGIGSVSRIAPGIVSARVCPRCKGAAKVEVTCSGCDGDGTTECTYCVGMGRLKCPTCEGRGKVETPCTKCQRTGRIECPKCGGTGIGKEVTPPGPGR